MGRMWDAMTLPINDYLDDMRLSSNGYCISNYLSYDAIRPKFTYTYVMGEWVAFAVAPIHTFIPNGTNHIECHYWLAILVDNIRRWGNFVILDMSDTTYSHNKNHRQLMMMHISLYNEIKYMFRANSETVSSITTALQYLILALFRKCPPQSGAQPKERSRHKRISIYKYHHSTLSAT